MELEKDEIIKEIEGFPNYLISSLGRIWSKYSNKWLTPTKNIKGNYIRLYINLGRKNRFYVHQLVANAFLPNHQPEHQINSVLKTDKMGS